MIYLSLTADADQLSLAYCRDPRPVAGYIPRYIIRPGELTPVPVVADMFGLQYAFWGLIPSWTTTVEKADAARARNTLAFAPNVFDRKPYRRPVRARRCLVPCTGWFEVPGRANPHAVFVGPEEEKILSLAGVFDIWVHPSTKDEVLSFAVLTVRDPSTEGRKVPLVLDGEDADRWLYRSAGRPELEEIMERGYGNTLHESPVDPALLFTGPGPEEMPDLII